MIMTENERYTERVRDAFENFLVSKFIEYKPFSITDDRIIADAKDRSIMNYDGGLLQWMQSFVSIMATNTYYESQPACVSVSSNNIGIVTLNDDYGKVWRDKI